MWFIQSVNTSLFQSGLEQLLILFEKSVIGSGVCKVTYKWVNQGCQSVT